MRGYENGLREDKNCLRKVKFGIPAMKNGISASKNGKMKEKMNITHPPNPILYKLARLWREEKEKSG